MRLTSREVPLDRDASGPFLPWIVAVMVYLASLAVAAALLVHQVTERWEMSLADGLTIQVPPPSEEDAGAVYSARVDQLVRLLGEWPGVAQARHLECGRSPEIQRATVGRRRPTCRRSGHLLPGETPL